MSASWGAFFSLHRMTLSQRKPLVTLQNGIWQIPNLYLGFKLSSLTKQSQGSDRKGKDTSDFIMEICSLISTLPNTQITYTCTHPVLCIINGDLLPSYLFTGGDLKPIPFYLHRHLTELPIFPLYCVLNLSL